MKQEDKELLLKDLSARLPYGVVVAEFDENGRRTSIELPLVCIENDFSMYGNVKPYLFPLSSMTKEQSTIYHELIGGMFGTSVLINFEILVDFFCKNHLDFRGLIKKGLAIDATGLNIYNEE
jgi:hypothetical protein